MVVTRLVILEVSHVLNLGSVMLVVNRRVTAPMMGRALIIDDWLAAALSHLTVVTASMWTNDWHAYHSTFSQGY